MNSTPPALRPLPQDALALAALALFLLASPLAAGAQTARDTPPAQVTPLDGDFVATTRINVREQPSARAARIELVDGGSRLRVTGKVADAPWYSVVTQSGRTGFVSTELLRAAAPATGGASGPANAPVAVSVPAPAAAALTPAPADPVLLERLDKLQARLDEIERRLAAMPDLQALVDRGAGDVSRMETLNATIEMAKGMMETLSAFQEQASTRLNEQREEFGKVSDRLKSVEEDMQPAVEWIKQWKDKAPPLAEEAKGWFSTATGAVYGWIGPWLPWGGRAS